MSAPIRDQLLTTLSLSGAGYYPRQKLIDVACSHPGCEDREAVERELDTLASEGLVAVSEGLVYSVPTEHDLSRYFAAADKYRKEMAKRNSWRYRGVVFLANIWAKIWGGVVLLVATSSLTLGLCAVEIPDAIIRALVHVESGAKWIDTGRIVGGWKRGNAGEISHFQLSSAAIQDMGATSKTARIESCPVLAESLARLWLSRCYERAGNWPDALSRYNAGSRYRGRTARDYAARIISLSSL